MSNAIQAGDRFTRWVVVTGLVESNANRSRSLRCVCDCGEERVVEIRRLISGKSRSCGCLRNEESARRLLTHGGAYTLEYEIYRGMLKRCYAEKHPSFARHGARGIRVCQSWRDSFAQFMADMGPRPSTDHSVERRDNDGHYEPSNCYWATWIEQNNNNRGNHNVTAFGKTQSISMWAREVNINRCTITQRLSKGWAVEKALTQRVER